MKAEAIPAELQALPQWLCWRFEQRDGKPTKVPRQAGRNANAAADNPATWTTFERATTDTSTDGVGFVFTSSDPYCGVDLDDCFEDGRLHPAAERIVTLLGSYTELSPSGTGVHVVVRGVTPGERHRTKRTPWGGDFEVYYRERYFCMTGQPLPSSLASVMPRQEGLDAIYAEMWPPAPERPPAPRPATPHDLDDRELLARASRASNGADFDALWRGDLSQHGGDHSAADLALCGTLAFYAQGGPERVDALFRQSGLFREKWDSPRGESTYGNDTVALAIAGCSEFYGSQREQPNPPPGGRKEGGMQPTPDLIDEFKPEAPLRATHELLDDVKVFVDRYVVLPNRAAALAVALWVMHTWAFKGSHATPYLAVQAPTKQGGKSRLLETLEFVVARLWKTSGASEAVLFRRIERTQPTLLFDEVDTVFAGKDETTTNIRRVINAGNLPGSCVSRMAGEGANMIEKDFSVYCPKVLAGIANDKVRWPSTIVDRAVVIHMKPRKRSELIARMRRQRVTKEAAPLRAELERWATEHVDGLLDSEPDWPDALDDRSCEAWDPLFAIADLAGGDLPETTRNAAVDLYGAVDVDDDQAGLALLGALRGVFGDEHALSSERICAAVNKDDDLPFGAWRKGEGLDARGLAKLLKPFGVKSKTVWLGTDKTAKGYQREQFEEPWARWFDVGEKRAEGSPTPPTGPANVRSVRIRSQSEKTAQFVRQVTPHLTDMKSGANPHEQRDLTDLTLKTSQEGADGVSDHGNEAVQPANLTLVDDADPLRSGSVYTGADFPDWRLRVIAVLGEQVLIRVESSNCDAGKELLLPLKHFGTKLERVA